MAFSFFSTGSDTKNEISWQEFKTDYLDKGAVSKLTVVNRSVVHVHTTQGNTLYFTIGSVDLFEERMEQAQRGVPPNNRVPVSTQNEAQSRILFWDSFLPSCFLAHSIG